MALHRSANTEYMAGRDVLSIGVARTEKDPSLLLSCSTRKLKKVKYVNCVDRLILFVRIKNTNTRPRHKHSSQGRCRELQPRVHWDFAITFHFSHNFG